MVLALNFYINKDNWGDEVGHEITNSNPCPVDISFRTYDLWECPEDATLFRDLFNGYDYIETLKLGMKLGNMGYNDISINYINDENEDEDDEEEAYSQEQYDENEKAIQELLDELEYRQKWREEMKNNLIKED